MILIVDLGIVVMLFVKKGLLMGILYGFIDVDLWWFG